MTQTLDGFGLTYRDVRDAVSVGDEITVSAEVSGGHGFADATTQDSGTVTEVGDYELRFDSDDRDAEVVVHKSGISVSVTRHLEDGGQYGYQADEVVVR